MSNTEPTPTEKLQSDSVEVDDYFPKHEVVTLQPEALLPKDFQMVSGDRLRKFVFGLHYPNGKDEDENFEFQGLSAVLRAEYEKIQAYGEVMKDSDVIATELNGGIGDAFYFGLVGIKIAEQFPSKRVVFIDRHHGVREELLTHSLAPNVSFADSLPKPSPVNGEKQKVFVIHFDRLISKLEKWENEVIGSEALYYFADPISDLAKKKDSNTGVIRSPISNKKYQTLAYMLPYLIGEDKQSSSTMSERTKAIENMMLLAGDLVEDTEASAKSLHSRQSDGCNYPVSIQQSLYAFLRMMGIPVTAKEYLESCPVNLPERPSRFTYDYCFFYGATAAEGKKSISFDQLDGVIATKVEENPSAKIAVVRDLADPQIADRLKAEYPNNVTIIEGRISAVFQEAAKSEKIIFPDTGAAHYFSFVVREWEKTPDDGVIPHLYEICGASVGFELGIYAVPEANLLVTSDFPNKIESKQIAGFIS